MAPCLSADFNYTPTLSISFLSSLFHQSSGLMHSQEPVSGLWSRANRPFNLIFTQQMEASIKTPMIYQHGKYQWRAAQRNSHGCVFNIFCSEAVGSRLQGWATPSIQLNNHLKSQFPLNATFPTTPQLLQSKTGPYWLHVACEPGHHGPGNTMCLAVDQKFKVWSSKLANKVAVKVKSSNPLKY